MPDTPRPRSRVRQILLRAWPLLASIFILVAMPVVISRTRQGRVAVEASIFLPDMVVQVPLPFRPVDLISDPPKREHVTIDYESRNGPRSIEADLYTPAGSGRHTGVVFSMGAPPLPLNDKRLVRIAEDSARSGVVMLVPFSDRLYNLSIEPEEVDALVAEFQYVQKLPSVDPDRVGFFGASVGGSLAIVAAGDPRIADEVDHVVSFGGYFDALSTFGSIVTHHIDYGDVHQEWTPTWHAHRVVTYQLTERLDNDDDRALLERQFIDEDPLTPTELASLTPVGQAAYDFLSNDDPSRIDALAQRLPANIIADLNAMAPMNFIDHVKAELFIIHDRGDPVVPFTESRRLKDELAGRATPRAHFDELRLFEHVKPKLNQDPEIIALDSTRLLFRLYQLLLRWD